ncbi:MAG TPA: hypothetical protein VF286_05950, partial [Acidiphilium sp.]
YCRIVLFGFILYVVIIKIIEYYYNINKAKYYILISMILFFVLDIFFVVMAFRLFYTRPISVFHKIIIAVDVQGINSIVAGVVFGATYWFLAVRGRKLPGSRQNVPENRQESLETQPPSATG